MKHGDAERRGASPDALRRVLPLWAFGLEGGWLARHQAAALARAAADDPRLAGLDAALAAWNFEHAPLDAAFAAAALTAARRGGEPPKRRALCAALARTGDPGRDAAYWPTLRDGADTAAAAAFLVKQLADTATAAAWRARAFDFALSRGLPALARAVADALNRDPALARAAPRLVAEIALAWDGPAACLDALTRVDATLFPRFHALAMAHCLAETGRETDALAVLQPLWLAESWHPGLAFRLHALQRPLPQADLDALPGRLFVFLYTWNRAPLLEATLESLAASRLGPARVVVLDNGGTDDTAAVCRKAAERFAPGRFDVVRRPVNVGAPAARNWLAAVSGIGAGDLGAYVDDDVALPPQWLTRLAGALLADPDADVAGARIVAAAPGAAAVPQAADVRLLPPDGAHNVRPLINYGPGPDLGLLATARPCPSVCGCCHVLRGGALAGGAPFDVRFSPSQFDDLARDLRGYLAGRRAVYAGDVAVAHHQHAGAAQAKTAAARGQLLGARRKLDGLFSADAMAVAAKRDADTAWEELETKQREVAVQIG
ncbi:glycosyltransferase family A protein [Solidesulfovibrio sp.]|uniref:glycosyltransferase family A protein n=1 Tax=Solidesulfovibrio sp. TaxID=2910990 RepID=UPI002B1EDC68|nr:glycosyltransferase family A protein [Solidesulfovibrio sp.]MEA5090027.1 glycosyltransferase family A protein [Solidesulfovibrio sp.]